MNRAVKLALGLALALAIAAILGGIAWFALRSPTPLAHARKLWAEGRQEEAIAIVEAAATQASSPAAVQPLLEWLRNAYREQAAHENSSPNRLQRRLAAIHAARGDFADAERLYLQLEETAETGPQLPIERAEIASALGLLYYQIGDYSKAEARLRKAADGFRESLGDQHPDYATSLCNLATIYRQEGDFARAQSLFEHARAIYRSTPQLPTGLYASLLGNLAGLYHELGDQPQAIALLEQARELLHAAGAGQDDPAYAAALNNLAGLRFTQGQLDAAEQLYRQALAIRQKRQGTSHPDYAATLENLAAVAENRQAYSQAERLYREALEIRRKTLGSHHPDYAAGLSNLAGVHHLQHQFPQAEAEYREALAILRETFGPRHPRLAMAQNNLAAVLRSRRQFADASALYREALHGFHDVVEDLLPLLVQRQQIALVANWRRTLDGYLSVTRHDGTSAAEAYAEVLAWKGLVSAWQTHHRIAAALPELKPRLAQLRRIAGRLGALSYATATPESQERWQRELATLAQEKEELESQLARRAPQLSSRAVRVESLQATIPSGAVLIDLLEYACSVEADGALPPGQQWPTEVVAFVVRKDRPVVRLELGRSAPLAQLVRRYREAIARRSVDREAGLLLRKRLWEPLETQLSDAAAVLLSPDGVLARLPWAALPGQAPDRWLLEERAVAVIPVPRDLAALLKTQVPPMPALLALGDVDYDSSPGHVPADAEGGAMGTRLSLRQGSARYPALPATGAEIDAVCARFRKTFPQGPIRILRHGQATEESFCRAAEDCAILHLATHGFFAGEKLGSMLGSREDAQPSGQSLPASPGVDALFHPGLLSGLVLTGANAASPGVAPDGILTAEEVTALPLRQAELVVLSACETGLGALAGGEGVLGLQRAFQIAGARTVVATLWKVDDRTTARLMDRFYTNLWEKRRGRLESLREAQLYLLHHPEKAAGPGESRGVIVERSPETSALKTPADWAGFVLSGDWR